MNRERARSGFTLVELVIVLAVISLIVGLAAPKYASAATRYRVKNAALQELVIAASRLARNIRRVSYTAVRREHNALADSLVNEALDRAAG